MDLAEFVAPKSDQINAEDLLTGPLIITIADVKRGAPEQPVDIVTEEFGPGRVYRPSKTMRRVLIAAWGRESSTYIGRRLRIYRDPDIKFGADKVGGIRISHLSDIDRKLEIALMVTRGHRKPFVVEPLRDEPAPQPKAPGELTPAQRVKGLDMLAALFAEADIAADNVEDWTVVVNAIIGQPVTTPDALTDQQLQALGSQLKAWKETGKLGAQITEILNAATLAAESAHTEEQE